MIKKTILGKEEASDLDEDEPSAFSTISLQQKIEDADLESGKKIIR